MLVSDFSQRADKVKELASNIVKKALRKGATGCEVSVGESYSYSVSVRKKMQEMAEHGHERFLTVSVLVGHRKGGVSCGDFSENSVEAAIEKALSIANYADEDSYNGLPDIGTLARGEFQELDLLHPWDISLASMRDIATVCEEASYQTDEKVVDLGNGAEVHCGEQVSAYANSCDFCEARKSTVHSISCEAFVVGDDGRMERDDWYTQARSPKDLDDPEKVGHVAATRALARLGARPIGTSDVSVLFAAPVSHSLVGLLVSAISGGNVHRKLTYLHDSIGKKISADHISIYEDPMIARGLCSRSYDAEGVRVQARHVVSNGVLGGYFLDSYAARRLGTHTTGNAGGCHNLALSGRTQSYNELVKSMKRGLVVTELMGQGVNLITGDYSKGASGFWVEDGQVVHPVQEVTIAGNLENIWNGIIALGDDVITRGAITSGSILVDKLTVGGNK